MYPHQAERLTDALDRAGVAAFVATSTENIAYITGFRSYADTASQAIPFAVFTGRGTALVVPSAEVPAVVAESIDVDHVVCFGSGTSPASPTSDVARRVLSITAGGVEDRADALAAALARLGVDDGPVAFDESRLTPEGWQRLADRLDGNKILTGAAHLAEARRVKAPYEIDCLLHALRIAEEALDAVVQALERGMTEREAAVLYSAEVVKRGAWPRPPIVSMGEGTAIAAAWPTDRALRVGDLVRLDVGCVFKGYHSTVGRTAVLGEPTRAQELAFQAVQAAMEAAIGAIAPAVPAQRIFEAAVEAARGNGLPHYHPFRLGHGIGLGPCEPPMLAGAARGTLDKGTPVLEAGEVLAVEAAHEEIGSMGMTVKNTVLVTSAGARALNRSHHGLVVLD